MNPKTNCSLLVLVLTAGLLPATASAQLRITEAESSEASGTFTTADWWELTNFGLSPVNLTGYTMDDSSASVGSSVALTGVTSIAPGESVVFVEDLTEQEYRDWWGSGLSLSVQVGSYSGSGVSFSSGGDGVTLFDSGGTLVDSVSFGSATSGTTFEFDNGSSGRSPVGLSAEGVNGAFLSQNGDIGSPGAVPEPATLTLGALGLASLLTLRRRRA